MQIVLVIKASFWAQNAAFLCPARETRAGRADWRRREESAADDVNENARPVHRVASASGPRRGGRGEAVTPAVLGRGRCQRLFCACVCVDGKCGMIRAINLKRNPAICAVHFGRKTRGRNRINRQGVGRGRAGKHLHFKTSIMCSEALWCSLPMGYH